MFRVFLLGIFIVHVFFGIIVTMTLYNRWQEIKGFKGGPISVLLGIFGWPWVLRAVWTSRKSAREPESSKEWESLRERVDIILADDRSGEGSFFEEWFRDYFSNPKIDPEKIYHERIYL